MRKGFDSRTNLPDDLQAAIPHAIDAGGSRGPQQDLTDQRLLEYIWAASLGEALKKGWVRLVPVEPAAAPPEPPPEPPPTEPPGGILRRLQRLFLRWGDGK